MNPSRLLIYILAALLCVGILMGVAAALDSGLPGAFHSAWWGLLLCLGLVAVSDAFRLHRLPSPALQRVMAGHLALGRWHNVQLCVGHAWQKPMRIDIFDYVPAGLEQEQLPQQLTLAPGQHCQLTYRLQPLRRGLFHFQHCEIRLLSPLGLWRERRLLPLDSQTRVYPDFTRLQGAPLLAVEHWLSRLGVRQQPRRGPGMEFNQLREFREGDTVRQIDWKATARKRAPIVREYQDDQDQQIVLMLDCGRRMRSQDGTLSHFDHALNASLLLAYVVLRQGDALGLYTFATDQRRFLAPAKGQSHLNTLLNGVYDLNNTQQPADFLSAASDVLTLQKRRALLIIVSNLRDEDDEALLGAVRLLSRRHRVLVVSLREPVLDSLRQRPVSNFRDALDYCGTLEYLNARGKLHEQLLAHGVPVIDARPYELGPALISRYLAWKKGGML